MSETWKRSVAMCAFAGMASMCGAAGAQSIEYDDWSATAVAGTTRRANVGQLIDAAVRRGELPNLHSVVIVRDGKLVTERYYQGEDQFWTMPIGRVKFGPAVKHDLRSATKSVVALLYGIALREGKVPAPGRRLLPQFPQYTDLPPDPLRDRIRVEHALSMTVGMDWPENLPYTDPRNPEIGMYLATDTYRYILGRPVPDEPGQHWNYNGGTTALLGHLIAVGADEPLFAYARERLFEPLSISEVQWVGGTNGEVAAASGLRMVPRDLAKLGQLVLNQGRWRQRQVVPAEWINQVMTPRAPVPDESGDVKIEYGYQWWLINRDSDDPWLVARGNGGQALFVLPSMKLVVVTMAGNYNDSDASDAVTVGLMQSIVLPALAGSG